MRALIRVPISDTDLISKYKENDKWNQYKKSLIQSIFIEKNNKIAAQRITSRKAPQMKLKVDVV